MKITIVVCCVWWGLNINRHKYQLNFRVPKEELSCLKMIADPNGKSFFFLPSKNSAKERLSRLSQWKATGSVYYGIPISLCPIK